MAWQQRCKGACVGAPFQRSRHGATSNQTGGHERQRRRLCRQPEGRCGRTACWQRRAAHLRKSRARRRRQRVLRLRPAQRQHVRRVRAAHKSCAQPGGEGSQRLGRLETRPAAGAAGSSREAGRPACFAHAVERRPCPRPLRTPVAPVCAPDADVQRQPHIRGQHVWLCEEESNLLQIPVVWNHCGCGVKDLGKGVRGGYCTVGCSLRLEYSSHVYH